MSVAELESRVVALVRYELQRMSPEDRPRLVKRLGHEMGPKMSAAAFGGMPGLEREFNAASARAYSDALRGAK